MNSRRSTDPDFNDAELAALIQLRMLPGLSDQRLKSLLASHDPTFILEHSDLGPLANAARDAEGVRRRAALALEALQASGVFVLPVGHPNYPERFDRFEDETPPVLFCRGRRELLASRAIAVIGARDSSEYGDSTAELLVNELARRDITVVSGLARGIDTIAHTVALDAGGSTMAVLGCGIDVHYPRTNVNLQERIAEDGLLVSEFAPGEPPIARHFPQRNRLIAAISDGLIVVEAARKSGTSHTVDWALKHGVEVFAVPNAIGRPESEGTNSFIQQGAKLITCIEDVLVEMPWPAPLVHNAPKQPAVAAHLQGVNARVYDATTSTAQHVDTIARKAKLGSSTTLAALIELEIEALVRELPGKRFVRVQHRAPRPKKQQ